MELIKDIKILKEEIEGKVYFKLFDKYIDFFAAGASDTKYIEICAEYLNSFDEKIIADLCSASIRYCNAILQIYGEKPYEFDNSKDVLRLINPACLVIPDPQNNNEPVIHLELNCSWEEEHGLEWIVRNNSVLYVGPYYGEDPWADFAVKTEWNYA